jgi:hypothetical protein
MVREIQTRFLGPEDDAPALYGLSQSLRRGYTTHVTNMGICDADQKILTRWRSVEIAECHTPHFQGGTKENYSDINLMLKSLLRAKNKLLFAKLDRFFWAWGSLDQHVFGGMFRYRRGLHALYHSLEYQVGWSTFHSICNFGWSIVMLTQEHNLVIICGNPWWFHLNPTVGLLGS